MARVTRNDRIFPFFRRTTGIPIVSRYLSRIYVAIARTFTDFELLCLLNEPKAQGRKTPVQKTD
jgi:hypothetical protein